MCEVYNSKYFPDLVIRGNADVMAIVNSVVGNYEFQNYM